MNICQEFNCPFFSDDTKKSYGCQRFSISAHCAINEVKGVEHNQYALHADDGMSPNRENLIATAIGQMVAQDRMDKSKREMHRHKLRLEQGL